MIKEVIACIVGIVVAVLAFAFYAAGSVALEENRRATGNRFITLATVILIIGLVAMYYLGGLPK